MTPRRVPPENRNAAGSPRSGEPAFLAVGKLRRSHGVRGEMLMEVLTDFPERIKPGIDVYAGESYRKLKLRSVRPHGEGLLVGFEQYNNPEMLAVLRNQILYVQADSRPDLEEGEFYHHQIIGLKALDEAGQTLGKVTDILETGANDVLVITAESGQETLLPYIDDLVQEVNLAEGWLRVRLLPGMSESEEA